MELGGISIVGLMSVLRAPRLCLIESRAGRGANEKLPFRSGCSGVAWVEGEPMSESVYNWTAACGVGVGVASRSSSCGVFETS